MSLIDYFSAQYLKMHYINTVSVYSRLITMPKFFYILLIFSCQLIAGVGSLQGQTYLHEPTRWQQYVYYPSFPTTYTYEFAIELKGDTLIDGKQYFKTLKTGTLTVDGYYQAPEEFPIYEYTYSIREEDQKFYIYNTNSQQESLLQDFDLDIGDTVVAADHCVHKIVVWIDTVYLGNSPRKRFHLNEGDGPITVIEGVGSTRGLFDSPCNDWFAPVFMQCFIQDQNYLQLFPTFDCSSLVSTEQNNLVEINIYPNPFTDQLNIQIPELSLQPVSIRVLNLLGTTVFQTNIEFSENPERINLEHIPPGMYVIWIRNNNGERSFKVIKQ
jgi:hypothetical protein